MFFVELGIQHKGGTKYFIEKNCRGPLDAEGLAKRIIEKGIKDRHDDFFYGKDPSEFTFFINDIG